MALNTQDLVMGPNFHQTISLTGRDAAYTIHGFEVNIHPSEASSTGQVSSGSSKVKITTITNQNWDLPNHHGNIVASNNRYLAYVLEGRSGYVIRLIQNESNNRVLLKGFVGAILDVSFAHANSNLLSCVDEGGNVHIWDLDRVKDFSNIQADALKVVISRSNEAMFNVDGLSHRLVWSPFVPQEEEEEEQDTCNIVVTHGNDVEVLDVHVLFKEYPSGLKLIRRNVKKGIFAIKDAHEKVVHDVSLSPDGSVLATASEDGHLKFWQVDWSLEDGEKTKCLHDFQPHKGAPVTRLIFCDNHLSQDPTAQFWRFLLTAANSNTEVKVWCTVSWKCLQTFSFLPPMDGSERNTLPHIILKLDLSASYLLAADAKRMALYILQLFHDSSLGDASVTSITEYLLTQPVYSFIVSGHTPISPREGSESGDDAEEEEEDKAAVSALKDFDSRRSVVLIKLHCVQARSMQELLVKFEPPDLMGVPPPSTTDNLLNSFVPKSSPKPLQQPPPAPIVFTASPQLSPYHTGPMQVTSHFSSLPTDFQDSPGGGLFQSLPVTNPVVGSPKLLTPSEFLSPAKSEPLSPSTLHSSSLPLLSSTTIPSSQAPQPDIVPDSSPGQTVATDDTKSPPTTPPPVHKSPGTLTSATLTSVTEFHPTDDEDKEEESESTTAQQFSELSKETELRMSDQEQPFLKFKEKLGIDQEGASEKLDFSSSVPVGGEGDSMSTKDVQQSLDNIFEILKIDKPVSADDTTPPIDFNEFTKMLTDPTRAQKTGEEERGPLSSTEKSLALSEGPKPDEFASLAPQLKDDSSSVSLSTEVHVSENNSEIVNAAGAPTPAEHLELLKEKIPPVESDEVPLLSDLGVTDESIAESIAEQKRKEEAEQTPWPDIGQPEVEVKVTIEEGKSEEEKEITPSQQPLPQVAVSDGGGAGQVVPQLAPSNEGETPVISELIMPSADIAIDMTGVKAVQESRDVLEPSRDQEDASEHTITPVQPDQEREEEEGLGQEVGGETLPTELVPKPKKKTKPRTRGKAKKNAALSTAGLVEQGYSDSEQESDLLAAVSQLSQRLASQREEINQLREEQQKIFRGLQQKLDAMTGVIVGSQRTALAEQAKEQQQKLDKVLKEKQQAEKQRHERLVQTLSQTVTTTVNTRLDKVIKNEMKNVTTSVNRSMNVLTEQLTGQVQTWLSSTDATVRDTLTRSMQTKGLPEQIGSAVARGVLASYQESFRASVVPAFERTCAEMMKQVDENFRRATADYLSQIQVQQQHYQNPHLQQLTGSVQSLQTSLQPLVAPGQSSPLYAHVQSCLQREMAIYMQQTKQWVGEAVTSAVQKEVGAAVREQVERMSPEARHEEEKKKKQEDIQRCLRSQQYNTAFEIALSTSDLQLVVYLCQQLSPDDVVDNATSPLSQPVLLSLIQQLSVNLQDQTELKMKYLEQCILALDENDEVTKSHISSILMQLSHQLASLEKAFDANPSAVKPAMKKSVKRLKMLSERLCQQSQ